MTMRSRGARADERAATKDLEPAPFVVQSRQSPMRKVSLRQHTGLVGAVALAAALLAAVPAHAEDAFPLPPETDRWIQVETAHFVFYSNASERRTLDLGRRLERFRATLSRFNKKFNIDPPVTTAIYVFKDDASMTPYKKRFNGKPIEMSGLFAGHPDGYYIMLNGERQGDPLEVIYHEYTHHFLGNNLHNIPAWFNEGLAECYGKFCSDDKTASIGLTAPPRQRLSTSEGHAAVVINPTRGCSGASTR